MKASAMIIQLFLSILALCSVSSCEKQEYRDTSLEGTVWVREFKPEDNIVDPGYGTALMFSNGIVGYCLLDTNRKVSRCFWENRYRVEDDVIVVGETPLITKRNYVLQYRGIKHVRSGKDISEFLP